MIRTVLSTTTILTALILSGCGSSEKKISLGVEEISRPAQEAREAYYTFRGNVTYREKMLLPGPGRLEVSFTDGATGALLWEYEQAGSLVVPLPFNIQIPHETFAGVDEVRMDATLSVDGRVLFRAPVPLSVYTAGTQVWPISEAESEIVLRRVKNK